MSLILLLDSTDLLALGDLTFTHPDLLENNGTITLEAAGGLAPFQYSIDDGDTWEDSGLFVDLAEGEYLCKVKDADGNEAGPSTITLQATRLVQDTIQAEILPDLSGEIQTDPQLSAELTEDLETEIQSDTQLSAELNEDIEANL